MNYNPPSHFGYTPPSHFGYIQHPVQNIPIQTNQVYSKPCYDPEYIKYLEQQSNSNKNDILILRNKQKDAEQIISNMEKQINHLKIQINGLENNLTEVEKRFNNQKQYTKKLEYAYHSILEDLASSDEEINHDKHFSNVNKYNDKLKKDENDSFNILDYSRSYSPLNASAKTFIPSSTNRQITHKINK
jgi:chromosome segregation ATPase